MSKDHNLKFKFDGFSTPIEVPAFEIEQFKPKLNEYCVVVFCLNEGTKFTRQISQMAQYSKLVDIIVADGGSTDGSVDASFLSKNGITAILTKTSKGGLSSQMRMAFAWAMNQNYRGLIVVDGNGKDEVNAIPNFIDLLDKGFDHVQGSRFIPGGKAINTPLSRLVALKLIHSPLISIASKTYQSDTTNGFRGYSRTILLDPQVNIFRDIFSTYELHYHLAIEAGRNPKFKTVETPVVRRYPQKGKTPTKISPIRGNAKVLGILIDAVSGKFRMKEES